MEKRILGKSNIEVTQVGFGVLTMGNSQMNLPVEEGASLISNAIKQGINFFDTAQYYEAYDYLRMGLELARTETPEVTPVICTKSYAQSYDEMIDAIEEACQKLNREYIDIFLLHEVRKIEDFEQRREAWRALIDNKAKGKIRAIGVSTHHIDVTEKMADIEECDVVFPLINYASMGIRKGESFGTCEEMVAAIHKCHNAGKGVFAMKAFGGGNLTGNYQKALDYVFSVDGIDSVMIGIGRQTDLDQIIEYTEGKMPKDFQPDVSKKKVQVDLASCEGCGHCKEKCPNKAIYWGSHGLAEINHDICLTCGYCAPVCPVRAIVMY